MPATRGKLKGSTMSSRQAKIKGKEPVAKVNNGSKLNNSNIGMQQQRTPVTEDEKEIQLQKDSKVGKRKLQGVVAFDEISTPMQETKRQKKSKQEASKPVSTGRVHSNTTKLNKGGKTAGSENISNSATLTPKEGKMTKANFSEGLQEMQMAVNIQDEELFDTESSDSNEEELDSTNNSESEEDTSYADQMSPRGFK